MYSTPVSYIHLDVYKRQGYATGAFRTRPTISFNCDAGMTSLQLKSATVLLLRNPCLANLSESHGVHAGIREYGVAHPLDQLVFACWNCSISTTIHPCMCIRLCHLKDHPGCFGNQNAVWIEETTAVHCFVLDLRLRSVIVGYTDHVVLYTDGSKTANRMGIAPVVQGLL